MAVPLVMTHPVTGRKSLYGLFWSFHNWSLHDSTRHQDDLAGANSSVFHVQRRGADGPSASLLERAEGAEAGQKSSSFVLHSGSC